MYFYFDEIGVLVDGIHYFAPQITLFLPFVATWARATPCLILIYLDKDGETNWVTLIWRCFRLKNAIYQWTRQRIHNTLIVVGRYMRLMGDKTIPNSAGPRLESFYPLFVAGIDLPHQCVDSYNPLHYINLRIITIWVNINYTTGGTPTIWKC